MRFEVNINKKYFLSFALIALVLFGMVGVIAYSASGIGGNPSSFGHSIDEIDWSKPISGNITASGFCINNNCITSWPSGTSGSGSGNSDWMTSGSNINTSKNVQTSGNIAASGSVSGSSFCIGTNCITSWPSGSSGGSGSGSQWGSSPLENGVIVYAGNVHIGNFQNTLQGYNLTVQGDIHYDEVYQINSTRSAYQASTKRYVVDAPPSTVGYVVALDNNIINDLCSDIDGCSVTIGMVNYNDLGRPGDVASRTERLFIARYYHPGSATYWRLSNDITGIDSDNNQQQWQTWDCIFTDGAMGSSTQNNIMIDTSAGFGLLNVAGGSYSDSTTTCRIIIED